MDRCLICDKPKHEGQCELPEHFGQCFDRAGIALLQFPRGTVLCHGIGAATVEGQEGWEIAHAWLEFEGDAYDVIWCVHFAAEIYRAKLKVSYVVEYSQADAWRLWHTTDYPGPWDAKINAVIEGNRERSAQWKSSQRA